MTRAALLALPLLAACATTPAPTPQAATGQCDNSDLARFTGQKADATLGAAILQASRARTLRWGPPRSAMTMDMRPDRVTVMYDDAMVVIGANCG